VHDTVAESIYHAVSELILANVEVLKSVERLQVLEEASHSAFVLNHVVLEGEGDQVGHGSDLLGELESGRCVEYAVADLNIVLGCRRLEEAKSERYPFRLLS
jgi:hypothetical protein